MFGDDRENPERTTLGFGQSHGFVFSTLLTIQLVATFASIQSIAERRAG